MQQHHDDATARGVLTNAGIRVVSSGNCSDPTNKTCTSLTGMREDTVNQVVNIKNACPSCGITVTGGTETGHAGGSTSHSAGYKVDLDDTPQLDTYLKQTLTRDGSRAGAHGGERYRDKCGNEYVRESNHWDITVTNGSCSF